MNSKVIWSYDIRPATSRAPFLLNTDSSLSICWLDASKNIGERQSRGYQRRQRVGSQLLFPRQVPEPTRGQLELETSPWKDFGGVTSLGCSDQRHLFFWPVSCVNCHVCGICRRISLVLSLVVLGYPRVNSSEAIPFVVTRSPTQPTCTPTTQASATALECVVSDSREEENIATYLLSSSQDTHRSL